MIATDGYGTGLLPELDAAITPTRGQVVATEPLEEVLYPFPHYARHGYDYWHQLPDRRLVFGGHRDSSLDTEWTDVEETTSVVQGHIDDAIEGLFGYRPAVAARWSGVWGTTTDDRPLVGELPGRPGVWVAAGYCGHGNVMGLMCGRPDRASDHGRPRPAARPLRSCAIDLEGVDRDLVELVPCEGVRGRPSRRRLFEMPDDLGRRFVTAVAACDEEALRECFAPDAEFRALIPPGLRERSGAAEAAALFAQWFGDSTELRLLDSSGDRVGDRLHISYRLGGAEDGEEFVVEQQLFCTVSDGKIERADLLCSGFRPPMTSSA